MTNAMQIEKYLRTKPLWGEVQLQKLLYYTQAWSLAWTGRPLFDDDIEAWAAGPVVATVWRGGTLWKYVADPDEDARAIVDAVYDFYGRMGGTSLSARTHAEGPWNEARGDLGKSDRSDSAISLESMRRFYTRQALEGESVPKPPASILANRGTADVSAAVARQRARWRDTLDELAGR